MGQYWPIKAKKTTKNQVNYQKTMKNVPRVHMNDPIEFLGSFPVRGFIGRPRRPFNHPFRATLKIAKKTDNAIFFLMSKRSGQAYVGKEIKITKEYFDDVAEVDVDDDFEYITKITEYEHSKKAAERRWYFDDHTETMNMVGFAVMQSL